jgi:hypothetical protein
VAAADIKSAAAVRAGNKDMDKATKTLLQLITAAGAPTLGAFLPLI